MLPRLYAALTAPRRWLSRILWSLLIFLCIDVAFPLPPRKPMCSLVLARDGQLAAATLSADEQWRMPTQISEVSPDLVQALIQKEDKWFWWHPGVNPIAIGRAAFSNLFSGKRVSGASTISMQVARMLEPKARTIGGKLREMFRAFQLEWHCTKTEILELYLSYLPYGGNVEGVKAASYIYFDRPPGTLSLAQCVALAVVPNRPNSLRLDQHPDAARRARDRWLGQFAAEGAFAQNEVAAALQEPLVASRHQLRPRAPHLCRRLARAYPQQVVRSTLDLKVQTLAEDLLAAYVRRIRHKGVSNGAVLVLDNFSSTVLAYCGSADFSDVAAAGEVDGVKAIRSPGSTLKPLAYAMAMDQGLLTPDSRMLDVPSIWSGYSPDNYDEEFRGPVSMAYALRHSLNIPAVEATQLVGFDAFVNRLIEAGFTSIRKQRKKLGLSVVLGGCGVSLEELTRLFSAFARGGFLSPYAYTVDDRLHQLAATRICSPAAAWLIADILSGIERPDLPNDMIASTGRARIAWKTGTSYGRRDAWSVGFTPRYTIGVWIGNFDGRSAPDLSGTTMAVPLLFELFNSLEAGKPRLDFPRPPQVHQRAICAETGDLPSPHCAQQDKGYYIRDISTRKACDQERQLYIRADSAIQYCTGCLPESGFKRASYPIYPPRLTFWYESKGIAYRRPPPHNPACTATFDGPGPVVISPTPDYEYLIQADAGQEILLQAASDGHIARHYWYINGKFYQSCLPGAQVFFAPKPGRQRIVCMDDMGRAAQLEVTVKTY
jgi:penicillin-binding protein 1C